MSVTDPRAEISHDIYIGQVYRDSRTDEAITLMYVDDSTYIMRNSVGTKNRYGPRRELDEYVGAGRYVLDEDAEPFGVEGTITQVLKRAAEYESEGGRKASHYAKGLREAADILRGTSGDDDYEVVEFEDLDGVGASTAANLHSDGYKTKRDVRRASDSDLLDVGGVGNSNLESIRDAVK